MANGILNFFSSFGKGIADFFVGIIDVTTDVGGIIIDGVSNVVDFLKNAFFTLNDLVEVFPIECRVLLLSFLGLASMYLAYKIVKGG